MKNDYHKWINLLEYQYKNFMDKVQVLNIQI